MKVLKLMIVVFILIMSVGAVCAAENITDDTIGNDSKEISETVQKDITTNDNILKTTQNDIYTSSDDSFTNLTDEIQSKDTVDLTHDYKFNNESDDNNGILLIRIILSLTVTDIQLKQTTNQEYSTLPQTT